MDYFFERFAEVQRYLSKVTELGPEEVKALCANITKCYQGLYTCGKKIKSSGQFIDFFVHDILDFTMLNKDGKNFSKDLKVFNINDAISQITEIQFDKTTMKNIKMTTVLKGFEGCSNLVMTDQKRLQ